MAREGARVAVADRSEESATATVALINAAGGQAIAIGGDVTAEADVAAMVTYLRSVPPLATGFEGQVEPNPRPLAASTAWSPSPRPMWTWWLRA